MWNRWKEKSQVWFSLTPKELRYLDENLVGEYEFLESIIRYDKYVINTFDKIVSISKKENGL